MKKQVCGNIGSWIEKEKVIVYIFGEGSDVSLYGFDSEVPVGIYQGEM